MSRSKYKNVPTVVDEIWFQSKREAARYIELKLLKRIGQIVGEIELQVPYKCMVNGQKICTYIADFRFQMADGKTYVEDAKGHKTDVYKIKKKLVEALYGISILEV